MPSFRHVYAPVSEPGNLNDKCSRHDLVILETINRRFTTLRNAWKGVSYSGQDTELLRGGISEVWRIQPHRFDRRQETREVGGKLDRPTIPRPAAPVSRHLLDPSSKHLHRIFTTPRWVTNGGNAFALHSPRVNVLLSG